MVGHNRKDEAIILKEEMEAVDIKGIDQTISRRGFLKILGGGAAAAALATFWPFTANAREPEVITVLVDPHDRHRSSLAAIVEHYCDIPTFLRYYHTSSYQFALQQFGRFNAVARADLLVIPGQVIRILRVLLKKKVQQLAQPQKVSRPHVFQSPFSDSIKPKVHLCYQGTWQNPAGLEARICPFDMFTANRGEGRSHQALDVWGRIGTILYPLKPGIVTGAGYRYLDKNGKKRKFRFWKHDGKAVKIQTEDGFVYVYLHLKRVFVKIGQKVDYGTKLGRLGVSGNATRDNPHVHIQMSKEGELVDPLKHLSFLV